MSKKNKAKFRKYLKNQLLQEINQNQSQEKKLPFEPANRVMPQAETPVSPVQNTAVLAETSEVQDEAETYIKKDLKKSAIIIGSVIILIVALWFIDTKTNFLLRFGDEVFRILNIN